MQSKPKGGEKMTGLEYQKIAKVGDMVLLSNGIKGYVGEITPRNFYVWQDTNAGAIGNISPSTKGYVYSWVLDFSTPMNIEVIKPLKEVSDLKQVIINNYPQTKDAILVEKHLSEEIPDNFIMGLIVKQYSYEILAEAQRREDEEEKQKGR